MPELKLPIDTSGFPDPGADLISRVAGGPDREAFFQSGLRSVQELERTLGAAGRALDSFESILDFGCGCGRMLLWLEELGRGCALHGTDVDAEAVAWCQAHVPYAAVGVNRADPPLSYADATFDLVFNHSVFTHLDERRQDLWLAELSRVTRPGGFVVLSTHGEVALPEGAWEIRDHLQQDGIAFVTGGLPAGFPLPDWYQNTWHAPWYVFEHWGRWFEILAYLPGASLGLQDHILLKRPAAATQPRQPIAARPRLAAEGVPGERVKAAMVSARSYQSISQQSASGGVRTMLRRMLLKALRPYTVHEDRFDSAVAASITELTRASDEQAQRINALERQLRDHH